MSIAMDHTKSSQLIYTFDKPPCVWYNQATKYKEVIFMKKHIYNEQNDLHYTLHGDVYLPDLASARKQVSAPRQIRNDATDISKGAVPGPL